MKSYIIFSFISALFILANILLPGLFDYIMKVIDLI